MSRIDWAKAPEWANAVVASMYGQEFYVSQFGGISARQLVGYSEVDRYHSADMIKPHDWTLVTTRQAPWTGSGLPPVGTVCEYSLTNGGVWHECTVKYVLSNGRQLVADCAGNPEVEAVLHTNTCQFRTLRTPEQIAEEEREKDCLAMLDIIKKSPWGMTAGPHEVIALLRDAGYRKQPKE